MFNRKMLLAIAHEIGIDMPKAKKMNTKALKSKVYRTVANVPKITDSMKALDKREEKTLQDLHDSFGIEAVTDFLYRRYQNENNTFLENLIETNILALFPEATDSDIEEITESLMSRHEKQALTSKVIRGDAAIIAYILDYFDDIDE